MAKRGELVELALAWYRTMLALKADPENPAALDEFQRGGEAILGWAAAHAADLAAADDEVETRRRRLHRKHP